MAITYTFNITNINCYSEYESKQNLAFNVWWNYVGVDEEYTSNVIGNTIIPYDSNTDYVPYEQLTQEMVMSWIEQYTDPQVIIEAQTQIESKINEFKNPINIINPKLPWDLS
jgi:hypothetical protein